MSNAESAFNYRYFQKVWDPTKLDGRTRDACTRCRDKRAKCDGQRPCRRCQSGNDECVYMPPKARGARAELDENEQKLATELIRDVAIMKRSMDKLGVEIKQMKARKKAAVASKPKIEDEDYSVPRLAEGEEDDEDNENLPWDDQIVPGLGPDHSGTESKPWLITLNKRGLRVQTDIKDTRQLFEFLSDEDDPDNPMAKVAQNPTSSPQRDANSSQQKSCRSIHIGHRSRNGNRLP
ncbi:hypothetical protein BC936DRAFT_140445 [Jimgerdemannia flammicorona]|uniref:Zn(2)-C6 fungal-type domain-containing protein n=1 Tax=Jimgerdemannia flammicorona TaxID=994334 RepID=A0A433ATW9_9FUNG|nr:hypothetical protein BC936DRAFT_140445 [Jimgerdemannia flammicorona]